MKYSSFATLAAALALLTMAGGHPTTASAKAEMHAAVHAASAQSRDALASQAPVIVVAQSDRFEGGTMPAHMEARASVADGSALPRAAQDDGRAPFDPLALAIAGFAVMASLALRRSPNK